MNKKMLNFLFILTFMIVSTLSFGEERGKMEKKGKMMKKGEKLESVMEDEGQIPEYQTEVQAQEPQKSGMAYIVRYESPREIYILAPLKSHKMASKQVEPIKRAMFKVAWTGLNSIGIDYTWEHYAELFHFLFDEFRHPVKYSIIKKTIDKETGTKEYIVTLAPKGKSHNTVHRYFRNLLKVNRLPKVYSKKISWIKENVFYYRSPALEKRVFEKSKYPMWLHKKGRRW